MYFAATCKLLTFFVGRLIAIIQLFLFCTFLKFLENIKDIGIVFCSQFPSLPDLKRGFINSGERSLLQPPKARDSQIASWHTAFFDRSEPTGSAAKNAPKFYQAKPVQGSVGEFLANAPVTTMVTS